MAEKMINSIKGMATSGTRICIEIDKKQGSLEFLASQPSFRLSPDAADALAKLLRECAVSARESENRDDNERG